MHRRLALLGLIPAAVMAAPQQAVRTPPRSATAAATTPQQVVPAPTEAEIHERAQRLVAHQRENDLTLDQYERIEHQVDRSSGANPRILQDRTYRLVPNGFGSTKILLTENGKPADPAEYRKQLQAWSETLTLALNPEDSRSKALAAKSARKKEDRLDIVTAATGAFHVTWLGRETYRGRACDIFQLDPNPDFRPHSTLQEAMTHITGKIWVEHSSDEMVRGEAHVTHDIAIGAGILGKLYKGATFSLDQAEVAPGVWLPVRYQYDFSGRKFFFPFEEHQVIEASHYRRLYPPTQALEVAKSELSGARKFSVDP